jgi:hypothetical protein
MFPDWVRPEDGMAWGDYFPRCPLLCLRTLNLKATLELESGPHPFTYYIAETAGEKWSATVYATVEENR